MCKRLSDLTIVAIATASIVGIAVSTTSAVSATTATAVVVAVASAAVSSGTATTEAVVTALGLGLGNAEGTAVDLHAVNVGHGLSGILGGHGDEGKAAALAAVALGGDEAVGDGTKLLEHGPDLVLGGLVREVADVELDVGGAGGVEAGTVAAGAGLVDADGPAVDFGVVHLGDCSLGSSAVSERHETKAWYNNI